MKDINVTRLIRNLQRDLGPGFAVTSWWGEEPPDLHEDPERDWRVYVMIDKKLEEMS